MRLPREKRLLQINDSNLTVDVGMWRSKAESRFSYSLQKLEVVLRLDGVMKC